MAQKHGLFGKDDFKEKVENNERMILDVNDRVIGVETSVDNLASAVAKTNSLIEDMLASKQAPAFGHRMTEPMEMQQGNDGTASFSDTINMNGYDEPKLAIPPGGDVTDNAFSDKMKMEAFMREKVKVYIHTTNEENVVEVFAIGVNGVEWVFRRGEHRVIPRYVVEGLARARPVGYECKEVVNSDGVREYVYPQRSGLRYPFSVEEDSPVGKSWLSSVLRQPS